jgi:MSHA pilin protein MshA
MAPNIGSNDPHPPEQGVSLVEIVVVITMLGIAAAVALPRQTHRENDVRASQIVALSINLRNAAALAHDQYVRSGSTLTVATLAGRAIHLENGYPDAGPRGIRAALADQSDFRATSMPTSVTYSMRGAPSGDRCSVTYRVPSATSPSARLTDLSTGGC